VPGPRVGTASACTPAARNSVITASISAARRPRWRPEAGLYNSTTRWNGTADWVLWGSGDCVIECQIDAMYGSAKILRHTTANCSSPCRKRKGEHLSCPPFLVYLL
jgi:hypothetical protein